MSKETHLGAGIRRLEQITGAGQVLLHLLMLAPQVGQRLELGPLLGQRGDLLGVAQHGRVGEHALQLLEPPEAVLERVAHP